NDQTFVLNSGQTLSGGGVLAGKLNSRAGSIINPGDGIGVLTVQSNLTLAGLLVMELNRTNSQPNDQISCAGVVNGGGTLIVTNLGPPVHAGDLFYLFNRPAGGFASVSLPPLTSNLTWTNKLNLEGTITVLSTASSAPVSLVAQPTGS